MSAGLAATAVKRVHVVGDEAIDANTNEAVAGVFAEHESQFAAFDADDERQPRRKSVLEHRAKAQAALVELPMPKASVSTATAVKPGFVNS